MEHNENVVLNLDRPRTLRLTNKVLKRFCAQHGIKMKSIEESIEDYNMMVSLVYEMLHAEDPELTPDRCDDLLDEISVGEIISACAEALSAAFDSGETQQNPTQVPRQKKNSAG